jgi:hypothetical protein
LFRVNHLSDTGIIRNNPGIRSCCGGTFNIAVIQQPVLAPRVFVRGLLLRCLFPEKNHLCPTHSGLLAPFLRHIHSFVTTFYDSSAFSSADLLAIYCHSSVDPFYWFRRHLLVSEYSRYRYPYLHHRDSVESKIGGFNQSNLLCSSLVRAHSGTKPVLFPGTPITDKCSDCFRSLRTTGCTYTGLPTSSTDLDPFMDTLVLLWTSPPAFTGSLRSSSDLYWSSPVPFGALLLRILRAYNFGYHFWITLLL